MAKAKEGSDDRDTLKAVGEILRKHGVQASKQADGENTAQPPKVEKDSFEQRAKVKDLSQDQGKQPEGVHQQMGWAARIIAERDKAAEQGRGRGGTSNDAKPRDTEKTASKAKGAAATHSEPTTWAERVIASRPQGYGHGKVEGTEQEAEASKATGKETAKGKGTAKDAKPKGQAKEKGKQADHEQER